MEKEDGDDLEMDLNDENSRENKKEKEGNEMENFKEKGIVFDEFSEEYQKKKANVYISSLQTHQNLRRSLFKNTVLSEKETKGIINFFFHDVLEVSLLCRCLNIMAKLFCGEIVELALDVKKSRLLQSNEKSDEMPILPSDLRDAFRLWKMKQTVPIPGTFGLRAKTIRHPKKSRQKKNKKNGKRIVKKRNERGRKGKNESEDEEKENSENSGDEDDNIMDGEDGNDDDDVNPEEDDDDDDAHCANIARETITYKPYWRPSRIGVGK